MTPTILYAGTYDGGVFKSTNGGENWSAVNTGLTLTDVDVDALAIDPTTPTTLYAGISYGGGVFKSTNSGENWSAVNTGLAHTDVYSPSDRPGNANHPLCRDEGRWRIQKHERRWKLESGQHRLNRVTMFAPWRLTR